MVGAMRISFALLLLATTLSLFGQDKPILNEDIGIVDFEILDYPRIAMLARVQGAVVVRVKVGSDGSVAAATAVSGPKLLITDALSNARKWHFRPEKSRDVVIVYIFKIEGLCNGSCPSSFSFSPPNVATITTAEHVIYVN